MSNYLAIATVTETLRQRIELAASTAVPGAVVVAERPEATTTQQSSPTIRVFMYQVSPNPAWRNEALPSRRSGGEVVRRSQVAFDLYYLLSFYGAENTHEPQRMLGQVTSLLNAEPLLTRQMIDDAHAAALTTPSLTFFSESDLAEQTETVKFTPVALNLEELSKLWSVFFQVPYTLSVAYMGSVVLIDGNEIPRTALPVVDRTVNVFPFKAPVIDRIEPNQLTPGATLTIRGRNLLGQITHIRIDDTLYPAGTESASALTIILPSELSAGIHGLQVVHEIEIGIPATPHQGVESNLLAFVLQPQIESFAPASVTAGNVLAIEMSPPVGRSQRIALLVGDTEISLPPRDEDEPESASNFDFVIGDNIPPGDYPLRLNVDGAISELKYDGSDPEVTVT